MRIPSLKITLIELALIFAVGALVFFIKLSTIPSGMYIDETLPAYSAYSIIKTGRDEYGKVFPLVFRFYGSYNPPLFIYLTAIFESVLGLTPLAVRLPSSLAGLLSVIPIYLLLKDKLLKNSLTSFVSGIFFVITPWIVLHSRVGYEVSLGYLLLSLGVYFTYRGLTQGKYLAVGMMFLSLSTYAAYAERFIVPFFIIGILIFFQRSLLIIKNKTNLLICALVGLVTQIPNLWLVTTPAFFPKQNLVGSGIVAASAEKIAHFLPYHVSFILAFLREFLSQYVTYFSPQSLFFVPDPDLQRSIPYLSVFYVWMIIPFFIGCFALYKNYKTTLGKVILTLLIVSPIPAALTLDPFSTHRALPQLLPLFLIIGLGIDWLLVKTTRARGLLLVVIVFAISLLFLWRSYFVLMPYTRAQYWGYGHEALTVFIQNHPNDQFVIDQTRIKPVYSQLAFYMKFDPAEFQKSIDPRLVTNYYNNLPFSGHFTFGNIDTRGIVWESDIYRDLILVGDDLTISDKQAEEHALTQVFTINDPRGDTLFKGFKTNPAKKCRISNYASEKCASFKP